jgi:hypothetical protein
VEIQKEDPFANFIDDDKQEVWAYTALEGN